MRWPSLARLQELLENFETRRLLVVGDVVLDEYLVGEVERISPEAPVPVVRLSEESAALGGAGNVVRNIVALGASCAFCAVVGDDAGAHRVRELLAELHVEDDGVVEVAGRPTTRKTRVVAHAQQMLRVDREDVGALPRASSQSLRLAISRGMSGAHGVILEDYGKGLFSPTLLRGAMRGFGEAELPVSVDPKGDLRNFRGADLIKPNLRETEALAGTAIADATDLARAVRRLARRLPGASFVVTKGAAGMVLFDDDHEGTEVATPTREVFDVQGAGDTAIAALTLALRAGGTLLEAALLANAASGVVVGKVGTATASPEEVRVALPAALEAAGKGS